MAQTKDFTKQDLEKALIQKIKENKLLKSQNERLIKHLQEQVEVTSSETIRKESAHKRLTQIGSAINFLTRNEQERRIDIDRIFQKISDLENRVAIDQKISLKEEGLLQELRIVLSNLKNRESQMDQQIQQLNTQLSNTNQALTLLMNRMVNSNTSSNVNVTGSPVTTLRPEPIAITEEEFRNVAEDFKTELNKNEEDAQLIYRLIQNQHEST